MDSGEKSQVLLERAEKLALRLKFDCGLIVCKRTESGDPERQDAIIEELIQLMQGSPAMVEPGLSLFSATRHLERIADHATNIAEDVIYLVEGEIVRHRPAAMNSEP